MSPAIIESNIFIDEKAKSAQYLTFMLGNKRFGINIQRIQAIQKCEGIKNITNIEDTPDYILGLISLRGTIIPVLDLGLCLGFNNINNDCKAVVIILKIIAGTKEKILGIVADSISGIFKISEWMLQGKSDLNNAVANSLVDKLAAVNGKKITLLNMDPLIKSGVSIDTKKTIH